MHGATSPRKGHDILCMVEQIDPTLAMEFMNEHSGVPEKKAARLNEAMVFVMPSRHEGNAYMPLEAMACGLPLVAYKTGLVPEMDERCGLFTDDLSPQNFIRLLKEITPSAHDPRGWMMENANLDDFIKNWREYLDA
jgi:glycosyltransferase involved in cell wall biosynthesis